MSISFSSAKSRYIAVGLSALVMMTGLSPASIEAGLAKEKVPALTRASVTVKVDQTRTIRIKNIKKKQIKSLTVKSADKEIATVSRKAGVGFAIMGVNAYKSTKITAMLDLKKKIGGKNRYRFMLKVSVNPAGEGRMNIVTSSTPKTDEEREAAALAEKKYQAAAAAEPKVTAVLQKLEDEKAHLEGLEHRLKTVESLTRKILSDAHDMEVSLEEAANQVKDSLRYTFIIDEADYVAYTPKILDALKASGNKVTKFKNYWNDDTRAYQGINCNLQTRDGVIFELQFHTQISYDTKGEKTHMYYEIMRDENATPEERAEAREKHDALYALIPVPEGVRELIYEVE